VVAGGAFATTADRRAFTGGARVYDFVILTTAFGATHKTTGNGGCTFVTHSILRCQGRVVDRKPVEEERQCCAEWVKRANKGEEARKSRGYAPCTPKAHATEKPSAPG
jgi:hypothetical protein